ncbi:MAG: hypothetical protein V4510_10500 [bacterium]
MRIEITKDASAIFGLLGATGTVAVVSHLCDPRWIWLFAPSFVLGIARPRVLAAASKVK